MLAFISKGLVFVFLLSRHSNIIPGFWGNTGGDTETYIDPVINFINTGNYTPDFRMPGYAPLFYPFALFANKALACNLVIILQYIIAALAVYPLALLAKSVFNSEKMFYLVFYGYAISTFSNLFDSYLLSESFSTSFLIFSVYYFNKALQNETRRSLNFLMAGIFLTETVFLKPVFVFLFLLFIIPLSVALVQKHQQKKLLKNIVLFILPFILFDGLWLNRNYHKYNRVIPLQAYYDYPALTNSYYGPLSDFIKSWGGSFTWWDPSAEIRWFGVREAPSGGVEVLEDKNVSLPKYIYTSKFNYDTLVALKKQLAYYMANAPVTHDDSIKMKPLLSTIRSKLFLYTYSIQQERPLLYYIVAPVVTMKKFLVHSGTYNLFSTPADKLGVFDYVVKIFYSLLYIAVVLFGFGGILLLLKQSFTFKPAVLITCIVAYTIFMYCMVFRYCESRYFVPAYPFMLVCATYFIQVVMSKFLLKSSDEKAE